MSQSDAGPELTRTDALQTASLVDGNGTTSTTDGYKTILVEVQETAGGTCTLTFQGQTSVSGSQWYSADYQQIDATASPTYGHSALSVTANMKHVYQIRDPWTKVRAVQSSSAGAVSVNVTVIKAA